eukprot:6209976-Pleurochrysis_carterae.AAC.3
MGEGGGGRARRGTRSRRTCKGEGDPGGGARRVLSGARSLQRGRAAAARGLEDPAAHARAGPPTHGEACV